MSLKQEIKGNGGMHPRQFLFTIIYIIRTNDNYGGGTGLFFPAAGYIIVNVN